MLWETSQLRTWAYSNFSTLVPERVLVELDEPLTFTFRDKAGNLMLAHWSAQDGEAFRYLIAPTTDESITRLEQGTISLRAILNQPIIWIVDSTDARVLRTWTATLADVPSTAKPMEDAMLHPRLDPLIKLKVPDVKYRHGAIGADAAKSIFDGAQAAFAKLVGNANPDDAEKYSLEAQQLAFNSIEVAFQAVPIRSRKRADKTLQAATESFAEGFQWANRPDEYELPANDKRVILEALRELAPKENSPIMKIEVSGRAVPESLGRIELTSNLQAHIAKQIPSEHRAREVAKTGLIREYDKDIKSFRVRSHARRNDGAQPDEQRFFYEPEKSDTPIGDEDVMALMQQDTRVRVSGVFRNNRYYVTKVMRFKR